AAARPAEWKKYSPPYGGFAVNFPHDPYIGNDGSWIYDAEDKTTNTQYRVIRSDIHNHQFAEEDTFDLGLMDESFGASEFIDKQTARTHTSWKGYPALDVQYKDKSGGLYVARYIIQGPHYYTLIAHGKQEIPAMKNFLNSFEIKPYSYRQPKVQRDTALYYSVKTPVFPESDKEKLDVPQYNSYYSGDDEEDTKTDELVNGIYRSKIIANDTTGEKIFVSFYKSERYRYYADSSILDNEQASPFGDTLWIVRSKKKYVQPGGATVWEREVSDTGSSRVLRIKSIYKDGIGYTLSTQSDTLSQPSAFVRGFFDSFTPADTITSSNPFRKKTELFFNDFMSTDTTVHKMAVKGLSDMRFDSTDLAVVKQMIAFVDWREKNYLETKKTLIGKLDNVKTSQASDFLKEMYYAAGDTLELQYAALEALLQQKTKYSYTVFRDIVVSEPPVLNISTGDRSPYSLLSNIRLPYNYTPDNGFFLDDLYDSLKLTKTILPDLLPLVNLDDYKSSIMQLLGQLIDSSLVTAKDYDSYFNKFFLEAKQEVKKQAIAEKQKAIDKAEQEKDDDRPSYGYDDDDEEDDNGNDGLSLYATLLMPFWDSKPGVPPLIGQLLTSRDKQLKYATLLLLLKNNKPYPDSLLTYFAGLDDYRYRLYSTLKEMDKESVFPARYNNHLDLGKSKLLAQKTYDKPDTIVYLDRLPAEIKNRKGYVYFYKYKAKKDDLSWKIASVGLVPADSARFEFEEAENEAGDSPYALLSSYGMRGVTAFTGFTDTRIKEEQPLAEQLKRQLKKILYSQRKSGRQFYANDDSDSYDPSAEEGVTDEVIVE
ncbi:MAG: hypothetical protein ABW019_02855, partial [Chitinophagaceae bacterium]